MKRAQLKKDFEETYQTQFNAGYMLKGFNKTRYADDLTQIRWSAWVCAWETYRPDGESLTGEYTDEL